ncbi:NusG domain II-containing protein [Pelomicrobium sp.]|jgi:hypothetical protein|uniref:NusG domain II-containing protein n=1 Tax=Pelomicrobium sp. TaxID=2815319 RepID=UPI002FDCBD4C
MLGRIASVCFRLPVKAGDVLVIASAATLTALLAIHAWRPGTAERALVRAGGQVFAELDLHRDRVIRVPGPLGETRIRVAEGRVRVEADPSPLQLCVKRGWLAQPGDVAVCLPNEVSVELTGAARRYDSLAY